MRLIILDMIWYSHVNEDSLPEIAYSKGFNSVVAVIGSGERLIALLDNSDLDRVFAVDTNADAIALLKLKLTALSELEVEKYLGFIGAINMSKNERVMCFMNFRNKLDISSKSFWDKNHDLLGKGILHIGQYEQFLSKVRPLLNGFLGPSFLKIFNHDYSSFSKFRWKIVKCIFSTKLSYKLFGNKDPAFIGKGADTSIITNGFQELIDIKEIHKSFMAYLVFLGSLNKMNIEQLPASQNPEALKKIQNRLRNKEIQIQFINKDILEFLEDNKWSTLNTDVFLSMSDILSFHDKDYVMSCLKLMQDWNDYKLTFVIRSYLKNHLDKNAIAKMSSLGYQVKNISNMDRTKMYEVNLIEKL